MSDIAKRIDEVTRLGLAAPLKAAGFRKSARTFHRDDGDSIAVINVQASQGNLGGAGKFTLNLGRYIPAIEQVLGHAPLTAAPKEYDCTVRKRIGNLMPAQRDHWWELDANTSLDLLAAEVAAALTNHGLPWLERIRTLQGLREDPGALPFLTGASLALLLGDRAAATALAQEMLCERPRAEAMVREWGRRNGVELADK